MKHYLQSKTVWFNTVTILVVVLTHFFGYQPDSVVVNNTVSVIENPAFIGIVNFLLRFVTTKGLTWQK